MREDLFVSDWGTLPRDLPASRLTNVAELIRSEALLSVLRLCGEDCTRLSDWELFVAFLRANRLCEGHRTVSHLRTLLCRVLDCTETSLCEENARALWERFLSLPPQPLCVASVPWLLRAEDALPPPFGLRPMLDGGSLLPQGAIAFEDWRAYIASTVERFVRAGCRAVRLRLFEDDSFFEPNPHAVALALRKSERKYADRCCVFSQLFRELCVACAKTDTELIVEAPYGTDMLPYLRYAQSTVGLPKLCVCVERGELYSPILSFLESAGVSQIAVALHTAAYPTEREMRDACASLAARYPIGRVRLITGTDLRLSSVARAESEAIFCRIMEKSFEKK